MDMTNFAEGKGFFFLLLNATIVWSIIAGGLLYLLRFKSLLIAIIISPFIIAPAFRGINGIPEALNIYATSIIYGILGIGCFCTTPRKRIFQKLTGSMKIRQHIEIYKLFKNLSSLKTYS